jgi:hypothetical protein
MRRAISINFLLAAGVALVVYGYMVASGLSETDPNVLRANRAPLGAAFLALVELVVVVLYLRRPELAGLARVLAALLGVIGLIQTTVIPLLNSVLYGTGFPTLTHMVFWYVYGSHLLFALFGGPLVRLPASVAAAPGGSS